MILLVQEKVYFIQHKKRRRASSFEKSGRYNFKNKAVTIQEK